jgi:predicted nucleic acid-binding protein
MIQLFWKL